MFKNCKKSVCSTNSILNGPNPKNVKVLRHAKSESVMGNQLANQGTNLWLKNGGVLPLVSVYPTSNDVSTQHKPVKQSAKTLKATADPNLTIKPQGKQDPKQSTQTIINTQGSLKSFNSTYALDKSCGQNEEKEKRKQSVVSKENYMNIISHFNEQDYMYVYNPAEYCEMKQKVSSRYQPKSVPCTTTALENTHYSKKAKTEILLSIHEELKAWRNEGSSVSNTNQKSTTRTVCADPEEDGLILFD